jgi:hypothetical protein
MTEISKAARNERRKLTATYLNNVATTFFVAGVATPYFAWVGQPYGEAVRILSSLPDSFRFTPVFVFVASLGLSAMLHWFARSAVDGMED